MNVSSYKGERLLYLVDIVRMFIEYVNFNNMKKTHEKVIPHKYILVFYRY